MLVGKNGQAMVITGLAKLDGEGHNEHIHLPDLQEAIQIHTINKFQEMWQMHPFKQAEKALNDPPSRG